MEVVVLAKDTNNKIVMVLLDFEKAYDRILWEFLEVVMEALGFEQ